MSEEETAVDPDFARVPEALGILARAGSKSVLLAVARFAELVRYCLQEYRDKRKSV